MRSHAPWLMMTVALLCQVASAAAADNLLADPGFEEGPWPQSSAWQGEMTVVDDPVVTGETAGKLVVGPAHHATVYTGYVPCKVGLRYLFTIQAQGQGTLSLRSIQLRNDPDDRFRIERPENHVELTGDWQTISIEVAPQDPAVIRLAVVAHLEGEDGVAYLDDASLVVRGLPGAAIDLSRGYTMATAGQSVEYEISASTEQGAVTAGTIRSITTIGDEVRHEQIELGGERTTWSFTVPEDAEPGLMRVIFVSGDLGATHTAWIDIVSEDTFARLEAAARATRIDTPAHILFLGDSLSDQRRGYNYTDMVAFWLDRVHGDVSYRNAAVGGDYITRMWARMQGENVHRAYRYDDLFALTPARVFIWTGANDSKLRPSPEYQSPEDYAFDPVVPLDEFEETFVTAVEHITEHAPDTEFTIISASASIYELRRDAVAARIADGQSGGNLFGRPDVLEAFNERMQSVAERVGADYVDVYEPTRTHPDRASIFTGDGVHITHEGNHLIAELLLEYLGE